MQKSTKFKIGLILIIASAIPFLTIAVVPFLDLKSAVKITLSTMLLILGELMFWSGGLLLGKELFTKFKTYLNPKNWKS
jgi:ABC-type Na+ efflux pump permease subunit